MNGKFFQYIMVIINNKLGLLFGIYNKTFGSSNSSGDKDIKNIKDIKDIKNIKDIFNIFY